MKLKKLLSSIITKSKKSLKGLVFPLFLIQISCIPSMQEGPDPHSIEFNKSRFNKLIEYFIKNPDSKDFQIDKIPNDITKPLIDAMKDLNVLEFRNVGDYKVFFCGYGVVGKGWGFIYGDFSEHDIKHPRGIKGNNNSLTLTYLKHLEGKWYRFGSM